MEDILAQLQAANPHLTIYPVTDPRFARYGRVLDLFDPEEVIKRARNILPTSDEVVYEPSVPALEAPSAFKAAIQCQVFGGLPIQAGWCYGKNSRMGALEYHKGVEVIVCLTDVVLLLGDMRDIVYDVYDEEEQITYDTRRVEAFYAPEGAVLEFHAWCLHFAPIQVKKDGSFATLVYLPQDTNRALHFSVYRKGEARLLFAMNKWLIAHPKAEGLLAQGAYAGLVGEDIVVNPV